MSKDKQAIQVRVLPENSRRSARLKAWCIDGAFTTPLFEGSRQKQAEVAAIALIRELGWSHEIETLGIGTLPNGDWAVTLKDFDGGENNCTNPLTVTGHTV